MSSPPPRSVSVPHPTSGVYSGAVTAHGEIVYVSGQLGCIDAAGKAVPGAAGDVAREASQALQNLQEILRNAGSSLKQVCRVVIYLTDIAHYSALNTAYATALREAGADAAPPARACFAVAALPLGALIEIECTALVEGADRRVVGFKEGKLFSAAVVGGAASTVWTSGQLALEPGSGSLALVGDDAGAQAAKALENMLTVLHAAGSSPAAIFRSTVFLTGIEQYGPMNSSYGSTLGLVGGSGAATSPPPSRAAFAVKALPLGGLVEVMCVASSGDGASNRTMPGMSASPVYSPAVTVPAGNGRELIYVSGQVALDPSNPGSKTLVGGGDVAAEMEKACENMVAVLEQVGSGAAWVLKTNIYCANMNDYGTINSVYKTFFHREGPPARVCVQVKQLPLGALVEICCFAVPRGSGRSGEEGKAGL